MATGSHKKVFKQGKTVMTYGLERLLRQLREE